MSALRSDFGQAQHREFGPPAWVAHSRGIDEVHEGVKAFGVGHGRMSMGQLVPTASTLRVERTEASVASLFGHRGRTGL